VVYTIMISVMKTRFILLFLIFISFHSLYSQNSQGSPAKEVRIGLFRFDPINFIDDSGLPSGLYPALIQEIAHKSHWKVRYVEGSFNEGLERLQNEEIDLMISVAWSEGRSEIMDYNQESVVELWGQVYTTPGNYLTNIIDLQGQTVGVMERDITGANLKGGKYRRERLLNIMACATFLIIIWWERVFSSLPSPSTSRPKKGCMTICSMILTSASPNGNRKKIRFIIIRYAIGCPRKVW
jgi:hypothetical protein